MTRYNLLAVVALAWASLTAPCAVQAAESYDNCTGFITSLPVTISSQGTWCLKQDLATAITSGAAITINTNNVTIDCNNFKLNGLAAGVGTSTAGVSLSDRFNATVRRCKIGGFFRGILFLSTTASSGGGHVVEDNRFDLNTHEGVLVFGDGSVIRRNRILDTAGSTVQTSAYGIYVAYNVDVMDNIIANVTSDSSTNSWATGIYIYNSFRTRIIGNTVRGVTADGTGNPVGIVASSEDYLIFRGNDLAGDASAGSQGITCANGLGDSARDNVVSGFASTISGCVDGGGNDIVP